MLKVIAGVVIGCLGWVMLAAPADAASIRNVYFSNGSVQQGQTYRTPGELPGPAKGFESGKDPVARMFIILGDMDAHKFRGDLKAADGKVVRKMNVDVPSLNRSATWRFWTHAFGLKDLAPGTYSIDLIVDDMPAGTHSFTLK